MQKNQGFTLIEILVVIGMIAVLATIVIVAINPARQFAASRDTQRLSNINAILNAMGENMSDNGGLLKCDNAQPTTTELNIASGGPDSLNLMPCLVPAYLSSILSDPKSGSSTDLSNYNTNYWVSQDAAGRITVDAKGAELKTGMTVTR